MQPFRTPGWSSRSDRRASRSPNQTIESYHFLTRIELDTLGPLDVQITEERLLPSREWKPRHRRGNADVDANHSGIEPVLELVGRPAVPGEDRGAVAIGTVAADAQSF